jgi:hypothetical protein
MRKKKKKKVERGIDEIGGECGGKIQRELEFIRNIDKTS